MRFRPTLWATVFVIPALIALLTLGTWQLERRAWKHDLIANIEAAAAAEPRDLVEVLTSPPETWAYARVDADGMIDPAKAIHLFSAEGQGAGAYRVIAPLDYGDGRIILVDLGSITESEKKTLGNGVPPQAAGNVHVEGLLRPSESPGLFDAAPDLTSNRWYARDVPAMAAVLGLTDVPPVILQSETPNPGDLPRAIPFRPQLTDNHLAYAVTWFSLALILVIIYALFQLRQRKVVTSRL
jgi:surfeit locus 1 family protein